MYVHPQWIWADSLCYSWSRHFNDLFMNVTFANKFLFLSNLIWILFYKITATLFCHFTVEIARFNRKFYFTSFFFSNFSSLKLSSAAYNHPKLKFNGNHHLLSSWIFYCPFFSLCSIPSNLLYFACRVKWLKKINFLT